MARKAQDAHRVTQPFSDRAGVSDLRLSASLKPILIC